MGNSMWWESDLELLSFSGTCCVFGFLLGIHHGHFQRQFHFERLIWADEKIFHAIGRLGFCGGGGFAGLGFDLEQYCLAAGNDD